MKIYISGKITGLPYQYVIEKFQSAQDLLEELGFEVVNPLKNKLSPTDRWEKHMLRDIKLLFPCAAIFMLENWVDSLGAGIEYDIASRMEKDVWFESNIIRNRASVLRIQGAVHEVTGLKFNEYSTKSRKRELFFARMLFAHHCQEEEIALRNIAEYIKRDRTTMTHLLKKYDDEVRYNPSFRVMAERVDERLRKV